MTDMGRFILSFLLLFVLCGLSFSVTGIKVINPQRISAHNLRDVQPMQDGRRLASQYALIPVVLLLLIAALQIYLARTKDLTPWKGGGFGMFSTTDGNMFRSLRVFVSAPERSEELLLKGNLEDLAVRVQMFPSEWLLEKLAKAILKDQRKRGLPAEKIEIDVWRLEFDTGTLNPHGRILRRYSYTGGVQE